MYVPGASVPRFRLPSSPPATMLPASSYHANTGFAIVLAAEIPAMRITSSVGSIHNGFDGSKPFTVISAISSSVAVVFMVKVTVFLSEAILSHIPSPLTPTLYI